MTRNRKKNADRERTSSSAGDSKVSAELRKLTNSPGWVAATHKLVHSSKSPGSSRASTPPSCVSSSSKQSSSKESKNGTTKKKKRGRPPGSSNKSSKKFKMVLEKDDDFEIDYVSPDEATVEESEAEESKEETSDVLSPDEDDFSLEEEEEISSVGSDWEEDYYSDIELDEDAPMLEYPESSKDLLISNDLVLLALGVYEILRHFRSCLRLSPMLYEDFCAALIDEDTNILLTECYISVLKALLREEDAAGVQFGPPDQKDSVHTAFNFLDHMTWPEVTRSYLESSSDYSEALAIVSDPKFPNVDAKRKILVLKTLTDIYLASNRIRDQLMTDGVIHYDDHCRVCHKLGDLLCCETCTAVYHLACCDPPLEEVPDDEWQCEVCVAHKLNGVYNCEPQHEFRGQYLRHEPIGADRHGNKFWFLARRLIIESSDKVWYYSTQEQFEIVRSMLDPDKYEMVLCEALKDVADEFPKCSKITQELTEEALPDDKTKPYLDVLRERLKKEAEEKKKKKEEDERKREEEKRRREEEEKRKIEEMKREEEKKKQEEEEKKIQEEKSKQEEEQKRLEEIKKLENGDDEKESKNLEEDKTNTEKGSEESMEIKESISSLPVEPQTLISEVNDNQGVNAHPRDPSTEIPSLENSKTNCTVPIEVHTTVANNATTVSAAVPSCDEKQQPSQTVKPVVQQNKNIQVIKLGGSIQVKTPARPTAPPGGALSQLKTLFVLNKDGTKTQIVIGQAGKIMNKTNTSSPLNRQILVLNSAKVAIPKVNRELKKLEFSGAGPKTFDVLQNPINKVVKQEPVKPLTHAQEAETFFRLGEDKAYRQYVNHYTENPLALNKYQHKEERDRERHLGYKFSMSGPGEFKWSGDVLGSQTIVIQTLRTTLMHLEHQIPLCFMHARWEKYRNAWGKMVVECCTPQSFAAALGILEMATRSCIKKSIWKDSHGLNRLHRVAPSEKEEFEKRRKQRTRMEEDESNKNAVWCKYPIPVRSTLVWKMKGEEYRMTGYGGWMWVSCTRQAQYKPYRPKPFTLVNAGFNKDSEPPTLSSVKKQIPGISDVDTDSEKSTSTTSTTTTKSVDFTEDKVVFESLLQEASSKTTNNTIVTSLSKDNDSPVTSQLPQDCPMISPQKSDVSTTSVEAMEIDTSQSPQKDNCDVTDPCQIIIDSCDVINVSENLLKRTPLFNKKWSASKVDILLGWRLLQKDDDKPQAVARSKPSEKPVTTTTVPVPSEPAKPVNSNTAGHVTVTTNVNKLPGVTMATDTMGNTLPSKMVVSEDTSNKTNSGQLKVESVTSPVNQTTPSVNHIPLSDVSAKVEQLPTTKLGGDSPPATTSPLPDLVAVAGEEIVEDENSKETVDTITETTKTVTTNGDVTMVESITTTITKTTMINKTVVCTTSNGIMQPTGSTGAMITKVKPDFNEVSQPIVSSKPNSKADMELDSTKQEPLPVATSDGATDSQVKPSMSNIANDTQLEKLPQSTSNSKPLPDTTQPSVEPQPDNKSEGANSGSMPQLVVENCQSSDIPQPESVMPAVSDSSNPQPDNKSEGASSESMSQLVVGNCHLPDMLHQDSVIGSDSTVLQPVVETEVLPKSSDQPTRSEKISPEIGSSESQPETKPVLPQPQTGNDRVSAGAENITVTTTVSQPETKPVVPQSTNTMPQPLTCDNPVSAGAAADITVTTTVSQPETKPVMPQPTNMKPQPPIGYGPVSSGAENITVTTTVERSRVRTSRMSRVKREIKKSPDGTVVSATEKMWKLQRYRKTSSTKKKEKAMKLPLPWTFCAGKKKKKSIFRLPHSAARKLALSAGRWSYSSGFNYSAKFFGGLEMFWIYLCPRPMFHLVWRYKLQNISTFASVAHLLRIFWHAIRWDEITTRPPTDDVVHTVTTDEAIVTVELLKRKDNLTSGLHSEYYIRRITMPILDPEEEALRAIKPGENYTPSRKGLRSSTRPSTFRDRPKRELGPQVDMVWVPEEQVELWQIRQFDTMLKQQIQQRKTGGQGILSLAPSSVSHTTSGLMLPTLQNLKNTRQEVTSSPSVNIVKIPMQQISLSGKLQTQATQSFLHKNATILGKSPVQKIIVQPPGVGQQFSGYKQIGSEGQQQTFIRSTAGGTHYIVQGGKLVKPIVIKAGSQVITTPLQQRNHPHPTIRLNDAGSQMIKFQQKPPPTLPTVKKQPQITPRSPQQTQIKLSASQLSQLMKVGVGTPVRVSVSLGNGRTGIGQIQLIPPGHQVTPSSGQQLMQTRVGGEVKRFLFTLITEANPTTKAAATPSNEVSLQAASLSQRLQQMQKHQQTSYKRQSSDMRRLLTDKDPLWGSRPQTPERTFTRREVDRPRKKPMTREEREEGQRNAVILQVMKSIMDRIERKEDAENRKRKREEAIMKQKEKKEISEQAKVFNRQHQILHRNRDQLKQEILKRRAIVEKYLTHAVKNELREDQRKQRRKMSLDGAPLSKRPKKTFSNAIVTSAVLTENNSKRPLQNQTEKNSMKRRKTQSPPHSNRKQLMINTHARKNKDSKLYCICRTPYDDTKFYIGCDLCMNWFHGSCVGISEADAKGMNEWVCDDCQKVKEEPAQELYCLCRTPYDDSKFYIGCDICQDWYHGSCVGVTEAESKLIEFYSCPRCKKASKKGADAAAVENKLSHDDYAALTRIIRSLRSHKMAWPFLQPVSKLEVPNYYKVIKRPMDLGTVMQNLRRYSRLSELVADISLIFDNCRQFNGADSALAKCAEIVESVFVGKMREYRNRK